MVITILLCLVSGLIGYVVGHIVGDDHGDEYRDWWWKRRVVDLGIAKWEPTLDGKANYLVWVERDRWSQPPPITHGEGEVTP